MDRKTRDGQGRVCHDRRTDGRFTNTLSQVLLWSVIPPLSFISIENLTLPPLATFGECEDDVPSHHYQASSPSRSLSHDVMNPFDELRSIGTVNTYVRGH